MTFDRRLASTTDPVLIFRGLYCPYSENLMKFSSFILSLLRKSDGPAAGTEFMGGHVLPTFEQVGT